MRGRLDADALAAQLEPAADALVEAAGIGAGERVLDVAAGDGHVREAAARRGVAVTAVDLAPEGLRFADGAFDAVLSNFGAIFAAEGKRTAAELVRVTRAGGRVALTSWEPAGVMGRLLELVCRHAPLPAGVHRPARWGRYETLYLFFTGAGQFDCSSHTLPLSFASAEHGWDVLSASAFVAAALDRLDGPGGACLRDEAIALLERHGRAVGGGRIVVGADYALTVVHRPG